MMISEIDIKDFDKGDACLLYQCKPRTYIQHPATGYVYFFDHLDGAYSYCTNMFNEVVHLVAHSLVVPLTRKEEAD